MENRPTPERTRRPEISAASITLADGLAWGLALPASRFRPSVVRSVDTLGRVSETIRLAEVFGYPPGIDRAIRRLRSECEAGTPVGQRNAVVSLGVALLLRAHDIEEDFAATLFEVDPERFPRLAESIVEIVAVGE